MIAGRNHPTILINCEVSKNDKTEERYDLWKESLVAELAELRELYNVVLPPSLKIEVNPVLKHGSYAVA
jgi:hypothetical protein